MHPPKPAPLLTSALRIAAALLFLAMSAGLFVGGAQPVAVNLFPWPWGKLVHSVTFGVLAMAVAIASGKRGWHMAAAGFLASVTVGALDEWHQAYLPGRHSQLSDIGFDAVGAALGVAIWAWIQPRVTRKTGGE
jgi:VanZ family protein